MASSRHPAYDGAGSPGPPGPPGGMYLPPPEHPPVGPAGGRYGHAPHHRARGPGILPPRGPYGPSRVPPGAGGGGPGAAAAVGVPDFFRRGLDHPVDRPGPRGGDYRGGGVEYPPRRRAREILEARRVAAAEAAGAEMLRERELAARGMRAEEMYARREMAEMEMAALAEEERRLLRAAAAAGAARNPPHPYPGYDGGGDPRAAAAAHAAAAYAEEERAYGERMRLIRELEAYRLAAGAGEREAAMLAESHHPSAAAGHPAFLRRDEEEAARMALAMRAQQQQQQQQEQQQQQQKQQLQLQQQAAESPERGVGRDAPGDAGPGDAPPGGAPPQDTAAAPRGGDGEQKRDEVKDEAPAPPPPPPPAPRSSSPLVRDEDRGLIPSHLHLSLSQFVPVPFDPSEDRVGCYKSRPGGFPGFACRWCRGPAGAGRYFPASEAGLAQTTTSQTLMNHVRNCCMVPQEIRQKINEGRTARGGGGGQQPGADNANPDGKGADQAPAGTGKPRHGGRKVFFHRLWCRIQGVPVDEGEGVAAALLSPRPPGGGPRSGRGKRGRGRGKAAASESGASKDRAGGTSSKDKSAGGGTGRKRQRKEPAGDASRPSPSSSKAPPPSPSKPAGGGKRGPVRLARPDDVHWLPPPEVHARTDLVEAFADGSGRVGLRCSHCGGGEVFPGSLGGLRAALGGLATGHCEGCMRVPRAVSKERTRRKDEGGGKGGEDDGAAEAYAVDAAREAGIAERPAEEDGGEGGDKSDKDDRAGPGLYFFRDPREPSPAESISGCALVPASEREEGRCTDRAAFIFNHFRPCSLVDADRRATRNRDRPADYPGIECAHCGEKRYFPQNDRKLQEIMILVENHLGSCPAVPPEVKASLDYLRHRSAFQRSDLPPHWKSVFFRGVWARLHPDVEGGDGEGAPAAATAAPVPDAPARNAAAPNTRSGGMRLRGSSSASSSSAAAAGGAGGALSSLDALDRAAALEEMRPMIKAAALWLGERDAEEQARREWRRRPNAVAGDGAGD